MVNCAFCAVVSDFDSSWIAFAGTPCSIKMRRLIASSPAPLTMIRGATPCLKSSAANSGRSCEPVPPPKTIITSALESPLSTQRNSCGKAIAAIANAENKITSASAIRKIHFFLRLTANEHDNLFQACRAQFCVGQVRFDAHRCSRPIHSDSRAVGKCRALLLTIGVEKFMASHFKQTNAFIQCSHLFYQRVRIFAHAAQVHRQFRHARAKAAE